MPINFNYKGNLRLQALQAFQAYTYYDYRAGDDILQIKKYKNINAAQAKKIIADRKFFVNAQFFSTAVHPLPDTNSYDKAIRPLYTEDTSLMRLNYRLLASSNLINWLPVATNIPSVSSVPFSNPDTNRAQFYRIDLLPNP